MKTDVVLPKKDIQSLISKVEINEEGEVSIYIDKPIHLIFNNTIQISINDELSLLSLDNIHFDSKNIYLNSRNCKQIRDLLNEKEKERLLTSLKNIVIELEGEENV